MESFINSWLVLLEKIDLHTHQKTKRGVFSIIKKQVNIKIKGRNIQFNYLGDHFGKIAVILPIDLQQAFKYFLGPISYAYVDGIGIMVKTRKVDLLLSLKKTQIMRIKYLENHAV